MPLQRRLPKYGFRSLSLRFNDEVRLHELNGVDANPIDLIALHAAGLVRHHTQTVKIILAGEITKAANIKGLAVTKGARAAIEAAGGKVED